MDAPVAMLNSDDRLAGLHQIAYQSEADVSQAGHNNMVRAQWTESE